MLNAGRPASGCARKSCRAGTLPRANICIYIGSFRVDRQGSPFCNCGREIGALWKTHFKKQAAVTTLPAPLQLCLPALLPDKRKRPTADFARWRRTASLIGCLGQARFPSFFRVIVAHPCHASLRSLFWRSDGTAVHSYPVILSGARPQNRGSPITHVRRPY